MSRSMDVAAAYEANACAFIRGRDRSPIGARVVQQRARTLSKGAAVIEMACGGGCPVTTVTGLGGATTPGNRRVANSCCRVPDPIPENSGPMRARAREQLLWSQI